MLTAAYVHSTRKPHTDVGNYKTTMIDYTNLYIKNLDKDVTSYDLFQRFKDYGKIISARVMKDTATGISKGYGFVSYSRMDEAQEARQKMQGARLFNKSIVITFHEPKKSVLKQKAPQQQVYQHKQQPITTTTTTTTTIPLPTTMSRPQMMPVIMDSPTNNVYPVYSSQPTSYSCHGFIPEHLSTKPSLPNPWNDSGIWMQKNTTTTPAHHAYPHIPTHTNTPALVSPTITSAIGGDTHHLQRTISSDSNQTSPPSLFQRQKLREAIVPHLDNEQMKDLDNLTDLIQSLRKRELSLCLFNPVFLRQKIIEAYRALYFSFGDEAQPQKPSVSHTTATTIATTPSLVHHHLNDDLNEEDSVDALLASLEGMSLNKKKRVFGDIFFPYVKATGVRRAPKITIKLLDTVPLDELAFAMYNKEELTRMAQHAAIEINCAS